MTSVSKPIGTGLATESRPRLDTFPADSFRFDYTFAGLTSLFVFGVFLDGWAHNHGKVDNTFFTPWHAVLYGSVLIIALFLSATHFLNFRKGHSVLRSLPEGYTLSLFGVILFFVAGGFDFAWHSLFGFEANLETLISPAHLLLVTAAFLIVTGPLRAIWRRAEGKSWSQLFPAVLSLTIVLSLATFFLQFAHFVGNPQLITGSEAPKDTFFYDFSGVMSVLIPSALTMGIILLAIRRWTLPFGALALMLTLNFALMAWMRYHDQSYMPLLVGLAFVVGLVGDVLLLWLKPSTERNVQLRIFAFVLPFVLTLSYFLLLMATAGTWWKVHMWLGSSFYAAIAGLFLCYLVAPP